jgi:hypothetical protein
MSPEDGQRERIRQITRRQFLLDRDIISRDQLVTDADVDRAVDKLGWGQQRILERRIRHRVETFEEMCEEEHKQFSDPHVEDDDLVVGLDALPDCLKGDCQ